MSLDPPMSWSSLPFFTERYPDIRKKLESHDREGWLPGPDRVFAALDGVAPAGVQVIIVGQDPYPTPGHANGLAFSVNPGVPDPKSLANIRKELLDDYGSAPPDGDLSGWARQGVLLLNTSLSVMPGMAGSHAGMGWHHLVPEVIHAAQKHGPIAFILWGSHASSAVGDHIRDEDFVIRSAHPSPLSAYRGFFGSKPFTRTNAWLKSVNKDQINWGLAA